MIQRVKLKNFKRFKAVTFEVPGHLVLAGPNNTGKTTLLQAILAFSHGLKVWKDNTKLRRYRAGSYETKEIGRGDFNAVPLRALDLLWTDRDHAKPIEIHVKDSSGWEVGLEFKWDTPEQIWVRPVSGMDTGMVDRASLLPVFVPATSGISREEPFYASDEYLDLVIGQAKPGDVLRNILVRAEKTGNAWEKLIKLVDELFGYELQAPRVGALISAEYKHVKDGPSFDIANAGSGFQQILTIFGFLFARPGSVLLIDEPDAHLHVILQEVVWSRLRRLAAETGSQLIVATHAETFIDAVEPTELCLCFEQPRLLSDVAERDRLVSSLRSLSNTDLMLTRNAIGVLYTEDWTDREILRAWARVLDHPIAPLLEKGIVMKEKVINLRSGGEGIGCKEHHEALQLVRSDLAALELVDGDDHAGKRSTPITGQGMQRLRWERYEIESYLVHPAALARYVEKLLGSTDPAVTGPHIADMNAWMNDNLPPAIMRDPLGDHDYLKSTKARANILPPILSASGVSNAMGLPYTRYAEIAALMLPEEIHPEVKEKLDLIMKAFGK